MKITCHVSRIDGEAPAFIQVTLYAARDPEVLVYEASARCNHVKEVGQAFAAAYFELMRQIGETALR